MSERPCQCDNPAYANSVAHEDEFLFPVVACPIASCNWHYCLWFPLSYELEGGVRDVIHEWIERHLRETHYVGPKSCQPKGSLDDEWFMTITMRAVCLCPHHQAKWVPDRKWAQ